MLRSSFDVDLRVGAPRIPRPRSRLTDPAGKSEALISFDHISKAAITLPLAFVKKLVGVAFPTRMLRGRPPRVVRDVLMDQRIPPSDPANIRVSCSSVLGTLGNYPAIRRIRSRHGRKAGRDQGCEALRFPLLAGFPATYRGRV